MQAEYLERLPSWLREVVEETEGEIGFSVEVAIDPERVDDDGEPGAMACEVEKDSAVVLTPASDLFDAGSVFHELQHIRRLLVEGAPKLVDCWDYEPWSPAMSTALTKHDNAFEHLVIVPRELGAFPERREHWEAVMQRCWDGIAAGHGDEVARRQLSLACWVFLRHVLPDSPAVAGAQAALTASGYFERAEAFRVALLPLLDDKEAAMRTWFEHQGIPLEMASLKFLCPQECTAWEKPLAA